MLIDNWPIRGSMSVIDSVTLSAPALELLDRLNPSMAELSRAIEQEVEKCPEAKRLVTHPGVLSVLAMFRHDTSGRRNAWAFDALYAAQSRRWSSMNKSRIRFCLSS